MHPGVTATLCLFIKQCSTRNDSTYLTGYTRFGMSPQQCTENVTFHATEQNISEHSWYDFAVIQFTGSMHVEEEDDDEFKNSPDPEKVYLVRMLGFV